MASADHYCGHGAPTNPMGDDNYCRRRQRRLWRQQETKNANSPLAYCSSSADQLEFKRKRRRDWTLSDESSRSVSGSSSGERKSPADGRDNSPMASKPSIIAEDATTTAETTTTTTTTTRNSLLRAHKSSQVAEKFIQQKINIREQILVAIEAQKRISAHRCKPVQPAKGLIVLSLLSLIIFIFISSQATQPRVSLFPEARQHHKHHHCQYQPDRRHFITFASAHEIIASAGDMSQSPSPLSILEGNTDPNTLPEPQAMAFNLLHELGSGEGMGYPRVGGAGLRSGGQRQTFADSASSSSSSVSPSLIEARCWNNYETDNDCKLLNVITGPSGGGGGGSDDSLQNQHKQHQQQLSDDSDNIITPIVIFEASSTIEPQQAGSYQDDIFGGRQYFAQAPTRQYSSSSGSNRDQKGSPNSNNNQYRTNQQQQQQQAAPSSPITANDFYSAPPQTATILPPAGYERPATRPSVTNSRIFVATPSPGGNRKATKTTTMGRKCRDENDADCDEPEGDDDDDNGPQGSLAGKRPDTDSDSADEDDDKDNRDNSGTRQDNGFGQDSGRPLGAGGGGGGGGEPIEQGSGGGAPFSPADDNDDSTDDDDDEAGNGDSGDDADNDSRDDNGAAGGEGGDSLDGGSGNSFDPSQEGATPANTPLLEVTSVYPHQTAATTASAASQEQDVPLQRATTAPVTRPTPTHRPHTGAEIEVVVHSTLPASFPSTTRQTTAGDDGDGSSSTSTTTSTTPMPDETFTSKPIFPSSTSAPSSGPQSGEGGTGGAADDDQQSGQAGGSSTTEIDLYTFKPIPIPVEQNYPDTGARPSRFDSSGQFQQPDQSGSANAGADQQGSAAGAATDASDQQQGTQEVSAQHIHEPAHRKPTMIYDGRGAFDDGWTTRRPLRAHSQLAQGSAARDAALQQQQQVGGSLDSFMMPGKRIASSKTHIGTDMLPTLLLYASIIILVTTALIFVIMAYVFWRRNTIRRRTLMQKAHMLDRGQPPHAQMIQSMSHASHLIHGNPGAGGPDGGLGAVGGAGGHMQPGLLSTYAPGKGMTMGKVTTSLVKAAPHAVDDDSRVLRNDADDADNDDDDDNDEDDDGSERLFNKGNSKDELVGNGNGRGDCGPSGADGGQMRESRLRHRLTNSGPVKQSSGSTDEPTTSSGGGASSSQRTQDSQQQLGAGLVGPGGQQQQQHQQQQQYNGQVKSAHYPNSLSDGRQNSSSISDSQCSPDASIGGPQQPQTGPSAPPPPQMHHHHNNNNLSHHQMSGPMPHQYQQQQMSAGPQAPMMMGPMYPQQAPTPFRPIYVDANGSGPGALGSPLIGSPVHRRPYPVQNCGPQNGFAKPRFVTSRSIEDIPPALASNQHVGFIHHPNQQQQVLYHQQPGQQSQQQHVMLPHLIQHRPASQFSQQHHNNYQQQNVQLGSPLNQHQQMISPQRIAMNPLATLSRRYPPGTGLNRTIYSEDSSSFMTTSPSLARTSSSSSFAFNLSKNHSASSIKAKPIVDASGRVTNDYTAQANFDGLPPPPPLSNGNGTAGPPVFGLSDRSEAWYV